MLPFSASVHHLTLALTPHNTLHLHQRYYTQGLRARASIIVSLTTRNE